MTERRPRSHNRSPPSASRTLADWGLTGTEDDTRSQHMDSKSGARRWRNGLVAVAAFVGLSAPATLARGDEVTEQNVAERSTSRLAGASSAGLCGSQFVQAPAIATL